MKCPACQHRTKYVGCPPCLTCGGTGEVARHPAKFTDSLLIQGVDLLEQHNPTPGLMPVVLDPFAGTGKGVEFLRAMEFDAWGVELEPEWADQSPHVIVGSALHLPFAGGTFDAVFTSPTYGNRMADHHEARDDSRRNTYRHALGRALSEENSGMLQWGPTYREFHERAWHEAVRALRSGGYFLLNCKDHIRSGTVQHVTAWHTSVLIDDCGLRPVDAVAVECPGLRHGANGDVRVSHESLVLLRKP